jgi:uncharacterized protein involved in exopolysaccharide biosynthesis
MREVRSYFRIIGRWWWVIILLFAATVGTMVALAYTTEPQYRATVTLQVSAPPPQAVPLYSDFGRQGLYDEIEQNRTGFSEFLLEGDTVRLALEALPDVPLQARELIDEESITVSAPPESQLLYVSALADDPETAALLANQIVEVGLAQYGQLRAQPTVNARQFIEEQLETARAELRAAETELAQFQINNKIGALDRAIDAQYNVMRSLKLQRDTARSEANPVKAQALDEIILDYEAELQNMVGLSAVYEELRDQVQRTRSTFNFLLERRTEAQIKENQILSVGFIQIITPARAPRN